MTACPHCPHRPHRPASIEALDAHVAAVHGKGAFRLVRAEPSEEMCSEALDEHAQRSTDPEENGEMMAVHASTWRAMLAASPPPTDAEIDELCALKARAKTSIGRETDYWWERREDGQWRYDNSRERLQRASDRDLMRAFLAALTGAQP